MLTGSPFVFVEQEYLKSFSFVGASIDTLAIPSRKR